jgi:propionyl-CoA synthetase
MKYKELYTQSIEQAKFWADQANQIAWYINKNILSKMKMTTLWYKDGELNICYLALDQHIQDGHGDQIAFVYDSPVTQTVKKVAMQRLKPK